jgi:hypothetical protein
LVILKKDRGREGRGQGRRRRRGGRNERERLEVRVFQLMKTYAVHVQKIK